MPPFSQLFPSLPPSITGKPVVSAPFRFPQNSSTPPPNATSTITKKPIYIPPSPMGKKAAQPGGLSTNRTNTIPPPFVAKPQDQNATGNVPPPPVPVQTDALARNGLAPTSTPNVFTSVSPSGGGISSVNTSSPSSSLSKNPPAESLASTSFNPVPAGTLGTGSPSDLGATQTPQGLMGNLIAQANANYQRQRAALQPSIQANQDIINKATAEEEQLTAGSFSGTAADYSGRVAQLENIKQAAQGNINSALGNINNALTPSQNAFGTALGAVTNFQQSPYGTPLFNPATGQIVSGGQQISSTGNTVTGGATGGGGVSPSDPFYQTMQQYAQMAANGQLSAVPSSITSNPVLNAQLNQMAKQINPSFNPVLSTGSAQTQQTGQQASAAAPAAYQALDSLQTAYNNLDNLTGATQVPLLNQLEQSVQLNTNLFGGRATVSAFQGALKEARAQVDAVLKPIIGVEAAFLQANALLPDNMLKNEIPQKIQAAKNYIAQRIQSYVGSGAQAGKVPQTGSQSTDALDYSDASFYGQ